MDFNATIDLIIRELNEAVEIIEDLQNYKDVSSLQVELAKSKCRNAAEVIRLLKTIQVKEYPVKHETETRTVEGKHVIREAEIISKPEKDENKPETKLPEPPPVKTKQPATAKKKTDTNTIADTFSPRTDSINEKLGGRKEDDGRGDLIKTMPIVRLSEAIGINDKFLFIRELFDGNSEMYNNVISNLDKSSSYEDARSIILEYTGHKGKNEVAKQLIDLVKRKFQADE